MYKAFSLIVGEIEPKGSVISTNKILNSIPKIIQQIKNINDDKENNQSSLFEGQDNTHKEFDFLPHTPWKQKELLTEDSTECRSIEKKLPRKYPPMSSSTTSPSESSEIVSISMSQLEASVS